MMGIQPARLEAKTYDYLIENAVIFDGVSLKEFRGDVAIQKGRIAAVGNLGASRAKKIIDAQGLALAPGFIDAHTHSDFNPLLYPNLPDKILQGVTTEVTGNCGMSAAPVLGAHRKHIQSVWAREGAAVEDIPWNTFSEYRRYLEKKGMMTNFAALVGHGNLRSAVMGLAPRPAGAGEIAEMKKMLAQAMREGAKGISFGLVYLPGIFAQEEELVGLCSEAARHSGVCAFHIRSEGSRLVEAIGEAIRIGREAKAAIQISHLKAAGKNNWEKIDQAFDLIEKARGEGLRIEADAYPYTAGFAELGVILPDALYQREDRVSYFRSPLKREGLLSELRRFYAQKKMNWNNVMIASAAGRDYRSFQGKTIQQLALERNQEPEQILVDLLADTEFEVSAFSFSQSPEVVGRVIAKPYVLIGSDSIADDSPVPHPRAYGSFPKVLKEYVRQEKKIRLNEAVQKMTSRAALHFGLRKRGQIKAGFFADLVLFDAEKIADLATYENPKAFSRGVEWVFINGWPVVEKGKFTGAKRGALIS